MVFEKLYRNTLVTLVRIRMGFFSPNRRTHEPRTATRIFVRFLTRPSQPSLTVRFQIFL